MRAILAAALAGAGLLGGCGSATPAPAGPVSAVSALRPPDHVWRSVGYGWIVTLTGSEQRIYQTTAISCLPQAPLRQVGGPGTDGTLSFGPAGLPTLTVRPGPGGLSGPATMRMLGSAADVDLQPLPALPSACTAPVSDDPVTNFDVFWQTMAENYNSFGRKNVDWAASRARFRPMVTDDTTPKQLFRVLKKMISPLGDAHVYIEGPKGEEFAAKRPGTRDEDDVSRKQAVKAVNRYLRDSLGVSNIQDYAGGRISWALLPGGVGYLRLTSFEEYGGSDTPYVTSRDVLAGALDQIFTAQRVAQLRGLVVDVRFNTGGDDALGLQLAGRLTGSPYVAYRKQPRTDPTNPAVHGPSRTVTVTPTPGVPHYTGPIDLLTSDLTVSAGETFVEAMLGRTPATRRIGTATQGVFSDDMSRDLPNGWSFTLGNEEYYDPAGRDWEGKGIPPDVTVPVFTPDELRNHRDSALAAALAPDRG
jgi:hypothetical protein